MKLYDVVIIGGGPVGSQVAYRLAGMGYGVVVVDQKERLGEPVCCTGIIGQECVSSFAIDEGVILRQVNGASIFSPSGKLLSLWRQEPQGCIVDRAAFNLTLASRAQGEGVEYVLNSPVRNIEVEDDGVSIEVAYPERGLNYFKARAVVIATGFGSKLAEGLGFGKFGDFIMGAQAEVETIGLDEVEVYLGQEIAPGFFAWLVPTSPRKALVGLLSRRRPGFYLRRLMSSLLAQGKITSTEAKLNYGGIPLKPLTRTYGKRLMVVGTAAGQVKPTTGGGIYYGLLCADMAANNLHRALKSNALSAQNLANYEKEWKRKLGRELRVGYWARQFYEMLGDRQIDWIIDIIKSNGIDEALLKADDLSFDWHGEAVLRLIGHQALSRAFTAMKLPSAFLSKLGIIHRGYRR
ncbi:geranylgeranyl reductase family protein [Chloroflexota bacterium]